MVLRNAGGTATASDPGPRESVITSKIFPAGHWMKAPTGAMSVMTWYPAPGRRLVWHGPVMSLV